VKHFFSSAKNPSSVAVCLCLGLIVFLAYYQNFTAFGLYGDDAVFFGNALNRSWREAWDNFVFCLTQWPQGRPLGVGINLSLLPFLVGKIGGLPALHLVAWLLLVVNMVVLYHLVKKVSCPAVAASAALFYGLCPAHVVRHHLTYAFGQISILCALLCVGAALSGRWLLFGLGCLITITMAETAAVAAVVAAVLLTFRPTWNWARSAGLMAILWMAAVGLVLFIRKLLGDPWGNERVGDMLADPLETMGRSLQSAFTGPRVHLDLVIERLLMPISQWDNGLLAPSIVAAFIAGFLFVYLGRFAGVENKCDEVQSFSSRARGSVILTISGLFTMVAVYAAYFRSPWCPADWRTGFMSGVHLVPAFGSALFVSGLFAALDFLPRKVRPRYVQSVVAVVGVGLLTAFGAYVQREYAAVHRLHQETWRAFHDLCRDVGSHSFVLILSQNLPHLRYAENFSWTTEWMPYGLIDYKRASETGLLMVPPDFVAPLAIAVGKSLEDAIEVGEHGYRWRRSHFFTRLADSREWDPSPGKIAVIRRTNLGWRRLTGEVPVHGGTIRLLDPLTGVPDELPLKPLAASYGLTSKSTE